MGHQIIQQPDGKWAVWSTIVNDFIIEDATRAELIADRVSAACLDAIASVEKICDSLQAGGKPYHNRTMTYQEAKDNRQKK